MKTKRQYYALTCLALFLLFAGVAQTALAQTPDPGTTGPYYDERAVPLNHLSARASRHLLQRFDRYPALAVPVIGAADSQLQWLRLHRADARQQRLYRC